MDWDDLDYQLAAASEELMRAHARAEQLTEEKSLLERRWARLQTSTHADKPSHDFWPDNTALCSETARREEHVGNGEAPPTCYSGKIERSAPPPVLADAMPDILKHGLHADSEGDGGATRDSIRLYDSLDKVMRPVATCSTTSHPCKSVLTNVPTSSGTHVSQQGRCDFHCAACVKRTSVTALPAMPPQLRTSRICSQADEWWKQEESRGASAAPGAAPSAQPDDAAQAVDGIPDLRSLPAKEQASSSDRTTATVCQSFGGILLMRVGNSSNAHGSEICCAGSPSDILAAGAAILSGASAKGFPQPTPPNAARCRYWRTGDDIPINEAIW